MKKNFYIFALLMAATTTLLFDGCKKKDDDPTKTELLTNGTWRQTAFTSDPAISINGVLVTNVFNQFPACQKDDLTKFLTTGIVNFDEGLSKCNVNDPQTTTGTWAFNSTQTVVSITENGTVSSYNIESLGESTLKANYVFNDGANNYTFSITWTKN